MRLSPASLAALIALSGCAAQLDSDADERVGRSETGPTWEEFLASAERDPVTDGVWIVDGDVVIESDKRLVDHYEAMMDDDALTVARIGGADAIWPAAQARGLTYCVSTSFGARHAQVVEDMANAAAAWEAVADVDFRHVTEEDARCDASNVDVVFDVRPTSGASYLARAFFPYQSRRSRNVIVDDSSFRVRAPLTLEGILRHELGHVLGFRHEHTRPEAGRCYEDSNWRGVTDYDRSSVMHYPHCGGDNHALTLSDDDAAGAAALYGAPTSGTPTTPDPEPTPGAGTAQSGAADGSVAAGREQHYQPLSVLAGSTFRAALTGTGDADLYVRFGSAPSTREYACRPYRADSNETCELTVPAGETQAFVMVRGYTDATYRVEIEWVAP